MTSQQAQIQELIQSIDQVLGKASPRLPWVMAGEAEQQRQVLEQTRQYLLDLQQGNATQPALPEAPVAGRLPEGISAEELNYATPQAPGESAQQVLQAVLQEVTYLRTNILQSMRDDVVVLRQEREELREELRELQAQKQQYALPPQDGTVPPALADFLQSLMGRLQENLTVQVTEMLATREELPGTVSGQPALSGFDTTVDVGMEGGDRPSTRLPALSPSERLEQLQHINAQSDQLLLKLDTTLRVIFDSLQRNIQTYEESLSEGLDKMHTLGHQGEAIFSALINRLAQQLGREASQYLQSSIDATEWQQALPGQARRRDRSLSQSPGTTTDLDALIDQLGDPETTILQAPQPGNDPFSGREPAGRQAFSDDLDDLDDLDLEPPIPTSDDFADPGEMTMFQVDDDSPMTVFQTQDDEDDMTVFQMDMPDDDGVAFTPAELDDSIDDIDSALELLNQISTDLETDDADDTNAGVATPEGIYDELDSLYQSLFGTDIAPPAETIEGEAPIDRHIADAHRREDTPFPSETSADEDTLEAGDEEFDEFERQLFEGFADLANEDAEEAPTDVPETAPSADSDDEAADLTPQSVENLLFDEVPIADEGEQEETMLLESMLGSPQSLPADVITSLEDLMTVGDAAPNTVDALRSDEWSAEGLTSDDTYIPASPDEDLLVTETADTEPRFELELDEAVLQQLEAELAQLEPSGGEGDRPSEESTDLPPSVFDELSDGPPTAPPPPMVPGVDDEGVDHAPSPPDFDDFAAAFDNEEAGTAVDEADATDAAPEDRDAEFVAFDDDDGRNAVDEIDAADAEDMEAEFAAFEEELPEVDRASVDDAAPPPPAFLPNEDDQALFPDASTAATETPEGIDEDLFAGVTDGAEPTSLADLDAMLEDVEVADDATDDEAGFESEMDTAVGDALDAIGWTPESVSALPPDREDLSLEAFQSVMATPSQEESGLSEADEAATLGDFADALTGEGEAESVSDVPAMSDLSDVPGDTTLELAAWFDGVEDVPEPIAVSPPGIQDDKMDSDALTDLILQTGTSAPPEAESTEPPDPEPDENTFTLEGLGDLFEADAPSMEEPRITDFGAVESTLEEERSPTPPTSQDNETDSSADASDAETESKKKRRNPPRGFGKPTHRNR